MFGGNPDAAKSCPRHSKDYFCSTWVNLGVYWAGNSKYSVSERLPRAREPAMAFMYQKKKSAHEISNAFMGQGGRYRVQLALDYHG